jgi:hypothetical protein
MSEQQAVLNLDSREGGAASEAFLDLDRARRPDAACARSRYPEQPDAFLAALHSALASPEGTWKP